MHAAALIYFWDFTVKTFFAGRQTEKRKMFFGESAINKQAMSRTFVCESSTALLIR